MSGHTPGPWMADTVGGFTTINVDHRGQTGQTITHMFDRHDSFKNASANAKLIAAAPEMARALKIAMRHLDFINKTSGVSDACAEAAELCRTTLAKAGL